MGASHVKALEAQENYVNEGTRAQLLQRISSHPIQHHMDIRVHNAHGTLNERLHQKLRADRVVASGPGNSQATQRAEIAGESLAHEVGKISTEGLNTYLDKFHESYVDTARCQFKIFDPRWKCVQSFFKSSASDVDQHVSETHLCGEYTSNLSSYAWLMSQRAKHFYWSTLPTTTTALPPATPLTSPTLRAAASAVRLEEPMISGGPVGIVWWG